MKTCSKETIDTYLAGVCPVGVNPPSDPAALFTTLAVTYPRLAADTFLRTELCGKLREVVELALSSLSASFGSMNVDQKANVYEALIEAALNVSSLEGDRIGFSDVEIAQTIEMITETLNTLEESERVSPLCVEIVAATTVGRILLDMKRIGAGKGMVAKIAENIEQNLGSEHIAARFITEAVRELHENVYYKMRWNGMTKLGNDSATGLRFVRHLDFVQVSSNPVIAARAYEEFPSLWKQFGEVVQQNPEWKRDPASHEDDMTLHATLTSILPNILVFRPLALLSNFQDGLVSYQLNPLNAENLRGSISDAVEICSVLREILRQYDKWLGWDANEVDGRPNIVFKVAASSSASRGITTGLNKRGIGTNNTVTYSVSQELTLLEAAVKGMAEAVKKNIPITQVYVTNMIGRLEDHLRDCEIEKFIRRLSHQETEGLAHDLGVSAGDDIEKTIQAMCSKKVLPSLADDRFADVLARNLGESIREVLTKKEEAIRYSGIYVTRRVFDLFFSYLNKPKWCVYFKATYDLSGAELEEIMAKVDLLPASKRRAEDTYLVLGGPNVTNTEFPDHQTKVWERFSRDTYGIMGFQDSIARAPDSDVLLRLLEIEEFRKVYALTPSLRRKLREIGIQDSFSGTGGMAPKTWSSFGAVRKTMNEFSNAYNAFKQNTVDFVKGQKN